MVSLKDFLAVMDGAEVNVCNSCDWEKVSFLIQKLNIHANGKTYSSVEEVYRDVKNPKVKTWEYTRNYLDDDVLEIWCKE